MSAAGDDPYEVGYRDGESSVAFDVGYQFSGEPGTAETMDDLLESFRTLTGNPGLTWPEKGREAAGVDWRDMFAKYAESIKAQEGYYLLHEQDFTPEEWAAVTALPGMERPV